MVNPFTGIFCSSDAKLIKSPFPSSRQNEKFSKSVEDFLLKANQNDLRFQDNECQLNLYLHISIHLL